MSLKDTFRALFKVRPMEKLLTTYTRNKPYGSGLTKLTPNHYSYQSPALRKVTRNGVQFELDISNIVDWNIYFGFYEEAREKLFSLHSNPDLILDIGANIGEISLRFAQSFPNALIYAFEPFPETFRTLQRNTSRNAFPNIELHPLGLGSKPGKVFFEERTAGNPGMNRVTSNPEKSSVEIEVMTLDLFLRDRNERTVSLIKIDVEGYELEVLKGAVEILEKDHPVLFIELDDENLKEQGASAAELIRFLASFGYRIRHAENNQILTENNSFDNCHFDIICDI